MKLLLPILTAIITLPAVAADVQIVNLPDGGIQPSAQVDGGGDVHIVYFRGAPAHGNLYHTVRRRETGKLDPPVRVNSIDDSAIAVGTIRGAQIAIGRPGFIHVAWMGSTKAAAEKENHRSPMLYTRSTDGGKTFERERNVITEAWGLDGGGAIAAGDSGRVSVFWHAGPPESGEEGRAVWLTRSFDDGETFAPEVPAWSETTGACGCCGMTAGAGNGSSWILYRSATGKVHRDIYLLRAGAEDPSFHGERLDRWRMDSCPMSAMALSFAGEKTLACWEAKEGEIAFTTVDSGVSGRIPKGERTNKFPGAALASDGRAVVAWIDGGGWNRTGTLAWQWIDAGGLPAGQPQEAGPTEVWTKPAVVWDGREFVIFH